MTCLSKKFISLALAIVFAALGAVNLCLLHVGNVFVPSYEMLDLSSFAEKEEFSFEDYKTLFYQTGLGKTAIDSLKENEDFLERLNEFQASFFSADNGYSCVREAITTCMEYSHPHPIAPYEAGYVLAMKSSHSFGWRHGHCGLIVGKNKTIEAPIIGEPSMFYSVDEWTEYPTLILLKLKDDALAAQIAESAKKDLKGIIYSPFAGLTKKYSGRTPDRVQCAYLVWNAFYSYGIDVDSDGGQIVTVDDIINSDKFEVVQVYGLNPDRFIENIKE